MLLNILSTLSNITRFFENLNLPKCNHKCYRRYKQTLMLFEIHVKMVENNTLFVRKRHKLVGYKTLHRLKLSLRLQFLLFSDTVRYNAA